MMSRLMTAMGVGALLAAMAAAGSIAWGMASRPPAVGTIAADFSLPDLDGRDQSLSEYRGKVVLLNFWATWCKPCTTEMPAMQAQYDKLRHDRFVVLAINELEDVTRVREHIRAYGHTFPVLLDAKNRVANAYGVVGLPVSVFIDQDGRVQEYIKGGLLTEERISAVVARLQADDAPRSAALQKPLR